MSTVDGHIVQIDVGEVMQREIAKRDRKIQTLEEKLKKAEKQIENQQSQLQAIRLVRKSIIDAAYQLDDYFGDDGP